MKPFRIALLGDTHERYLPHQKLVECLTDLQATFPFRFDWIPTETLRETTNALSAYAGIWAGSGPYKSKTGIINGIRFARERNVPFLGTCSGFGYAMLEFAQHLFGLETVHHPYDGEQPTDAPVLLTKLATCGLGLTDVRFSISDNTLAHRLYGPTEIVTEQSQCAYGIHPAYVSHFTAKGMVVSAFDALGEPKIMEYQPNRFFMSTLFYPHFRSEAEQPHPLIRAFLASAQAVANSEIPVSTLNFCA